MPTYIRPKNYWRPPVIARRDRDQERSDALIRFGFGCDIEQTLDALELVDHTLAGI